MQKEKNIEQLLQEQTSYLESRITGLEKKMQPVIDAFNANKTFRETVAMYAKNVGLVAATVVAVKILWTFILVDVFHAETSGSDIIKTSK